MAPYFQRMKLVSSSWLRPRTILDQKTTVALGAPRVNHVLSSVTLHGKNHRGYNKHVRIEELLKRSGGHVKAVISSAIILGTTAISKGVGHDVCLIFMETLCNILKYSHEHMVSAQKVEDKAYRAHHLFQFYSVCCLQWCD